MDSAIGLVYGFTIGAATAIGLISFKIYAEDRFKIWLQELNQKGFHRFRCSGKWEVKLYCKSRRVVSRCLKCGKVKIKPFAGGDYIPKNMMLVDGKLD